MAKSLEIKETELASSPTDEAIEKAINEYRARVAKTVETKVALYYNGAPINEGPVGIEDFRRFNGKL